MRGKSALALGLLTAGCAARPVPEAYRKAWERSPKQIDENIERHRKGDAAIIVVGGATARPGGRYALRIQQRTHEFLFGCNLFVLGQLDTPELKRKYEQAFAKLFNFATLPFYWRDLEPQPGQAAVCRRTRRASGVVRRRIAWSSGARPTASRPRATP